MTRTHAAALSSLLLLGGCYPYTPPALSPVTQPAAAPSATPVIAPAMPPRG